MTDQSYVYAGVGWWRGGTRGGVFRLDTGGGECRQLTRGLPEETHVQAVTVDPENPEIVYIGTQDGPYRSTDRGEHWERLGFPDRGMQVWSILVDPKKPRTLYAGTSPVAVYRSEDGGDNWRRLADPRMPERVRMPFACRVMRLAKDAARPAEIYAVLEVDGVMRSLDDGETWQDCSEDLIRLAGPDASPRDREGMLDGHALSVSAAGPSTVFVAVRKGLFRSADRGDSWQDMEIGRYSPLRYGRDIRVSPHDPQVLYACLSPAAQSTDGALYRSEDFGESWQRFDHGVKAEATMMVSRSIRAITIRSTASRGVVRSLARETAAATGRSIGCRRAATTPTRSPAADGRGEPPPPRLRRRLCADNAPWRPRPRNGVGLKADKTPLINPV
jgi:photosystem II stability/assembly factor-like uncharacterized protein